MPTIHEHLVSTAPPVLLLLLFLFDQGAILSTRDIKMLYTTTIKKTVVLNREAPLMEGRPCHPFMLLGRFSLTINKDR